MVSGRLISQSRQLNFMAEVVTEILRSLSIFIQSPVAWRAATGWRPAEEQAFFSQVGLAGIRMTDDPEVATPVHFSLMVPVR